MKKIIVFTATYNESENIINFIKSVDTIDIDLTLLIIDDNSPDGTSKIIEGYTPKNIKVLLIKREKKLGLDTAHKLAYTYALDNKFNYLITMDADMSHDPKKIPAFINNLSLSKFVIGSRYAEGGKCKMKWSRLFLSYYGNKLIKFVLGIHSSEFTTSFRGFNLDKLGGFNLNNVRSAGYSFFMETIYQLDKLNVIIHEIPIEFLDRKYGKSKIPKIELLRTLFNLFKIKFLSWYEAINK
jgi:dolichol-phosphate mannosyltransferase